MIKQTLEQKIEALTPSRLIKWLAFIFAAAAVTVIVVLFFYFNKFHAKLSTSNADWGGIW